MASKAQALAQLHQCLNGPRKAGPKWVTYSREQVMAALDVIKQLQLREIEERYINAHRHGRSGTKSGDGNV